MSRLLVFALMAVTLTGTAVAQNGYRIKINLKGYIGKKSCRLPIMETRLNS